MIAIFSFSCLALSVNREIIPNDICIERDINQNTGSNLTDRKFIFNVRFLLKKYRAEINQSALPFHISMETNELYQVKS